MKKYIVFIVSFCLLLLLVQIGSGYLLTAFYTPELNPGDVLLSQEVVFGGSNVFPFIGTVIAGTLAFFIVDKLYLER
ncbi:hypothetical protein [Bacillus sp. PS06]|uniref:hypothetical protein n=1 Tax=Bacillus sp. PS06 TaxID=2764176 RepID=UPI0017871E9F|nr:hypothetical protein [Bacillus sp. PS06]MBD8071148.1 hypothetical protein [Bacillus sp. PS06]